MTKYSRISAGVCIVGCGEIPRRHAGAIAQLPNPPCLFFASWSAEKAEKYRRDFDGFGSCGRPCPARGFTQQCICTSHALYVQHSKLAASKGAHILMAPLARTLEEADEIL